MMKRKEFMLGAVAGLFFAAAATAVRDILARDDD